MPVPKDDTALTGDYNACIDSDHTAWNDALDHTAWNDVSPTWHWLHHCEWSTLELQVIQ